MMADGWARVVKTGFFTAGMALMAAESACNEVFVSAEGIVIGFADVRWGGFGLPFDPIISSGLAGMVEARRGVPDIELCADGRGGLSSGSPVVRLGVDGPEGATTGLGVGPAANAGAI